MTLLLTFSGLLLDLLIGDPPRLPHPVRWIGRWIAALEERMYRWPRSPQGRRLTGILLVTLVVLTTFGLAWAALAALRQISPFLALAGEAWLISTTLAARGLGVAAKEVALPLQAGNLAGARQRLAGIVGRDTDNLDTPEIARATIETVAENTVDAVVAPCFYALLGGAPLALAYRAVNTLDSMLGYRNERYLHFGWTAARLDDLANYLPARLTLPLMSLAATVMGANGRNAWRTGLREHDRHPSPNAGWAEAAAAGALGVCLGGTNYYQGIPSVRPVLGPGNPLPGSQDIGRVVRLLNTVTLLLFILIALTTVGLVTSPRLGGWN